MKNLLAIFKILMKLATQKLISLKSLAFPIIKSTVIKTTSRLTLNKNNSPFKSQGSIRHFSFTPSLSNNGSDNSENDSNNLGWTDHNYKLILPNKQITKSILNLALLSFYNKVLQNTTKDNLILLTLRVKLSNGEERFIKYLSFFPKGEKMYNKILYLLDSNLKLKTLFWKDEDKKERHSEIIFRYKIIKK
jgi:hypothetical protein